MPRTHRVAVAVALVGVASPTWTGSLDAQVEERPVLAGTAYLGDAPMARGTVVLHHLTAEGQGPPDSLALSGDGSFAFALPSVPDPVRRDVFFASVRHQGVLYFGPAITAAVQLDSLYEIHAYDTLLAPAEGMPVPLQARSVFFEPEETGWRVTDLFQLRNDEPRTIVARPDGRVWSHPLPPAARDVTVGEGELSFDAAEVVDGTLVVRAALPPGERLFVVRYRVDSPLIEIPNGGTTEAFDVLVREPAPALDVEGLELLDRIELEAGSTYLRFTGADVTASAVRLVPREEPSRPRVEWVAVILALVLAGAGLLVLRGGAERPVPVVAVDDRRGLLLEVARLDDEYDRAHLSETERRVYRRRRAALLRRIDEVD